MGFGQHNGAPTTSTHPVAHWLLPRLETLGGAAGNSGNPGVEGCRGACGVQGGHGFCHLPALWRA